MPIPPTAPVLDAFLVGAVLDQPDTALLFALLDQRPDLIPTAAGLLGDKDPRAVALFDRYFPDPPEVFEIPEQYMVRPVTGKGGAMSRANRPASCTRPEATVTGVHRQRSDDHARAPTTGPGYMIKEKDPMALFKRGNYWWIDFYYQEKRCRQKIGTTRTAAEAALNQVSPSAAGGTTAKGRRNAP